VEAELFPAYEQAVLVLYCIVCTKRERIGGWSGVVYLTAGEVLVWTLFGWLVKAESLSLE
jgi:hypothetical protein